MKKQKFPRYSFTKPGKGAASLAPSIRYVMEENYCLCGCGGRVQWDARHFSEYIRGHRARLPFSSTYILGHVGYGKGQKRDPKIGKKTGDTLRAGRWWQKSFKTIEEARTFRRGIRAKVKTHNINSNIEQILQGAMDVRGLLYDKQYPIIGQPDFAFPDRYIAIFADGDYWHGNPSKYSDNDNWIGGKKVKEKRIIDSSINAALKSQGWTVLRFWETDIKANPSRCVDEIERCLSEYELSSKGQ
jgi:DNA mismatch endonuclease (patch repair protein)